MTVCRSCGAEIFWVRSCSGKPMPIDLLASPEGNISVQGGVARVHVGRDREVELAQGSGMLFTSHFATCPDAEQHRQR